MYLILKLCFQAEIFLYSLYFYIDHVFFFLVLCLLALCEYPYQIYSRLEFHWILKKKKKMRENGFELTKKRSRRYPAKTITDADYADDIALLANTPNQAETLLHSLERTAAGIGLHVNALKSEYMCYN